MKRLDGKIALITGAASGIGRTTARMLAEEGASVVVTDINLDGAKSLAEAIGEKAMALAHDVTDEAAWISALDQAVARFGGLHILVNCAGTAMTGSVEDTSLDDWRALHALDMDSVFLGCKYAIAPIAASGAVRSSISRRSRASSPGTIWRPTILPRRPYGI